MVDLNYIYGFYPPAIANNNTFSKHLLKEYVELLVLEFLSRSPYASKLTFIGGTNLRLVQGIDRFSEDLDFDIKDLTEKDFMSMTQSVQHYLVQQGIPAEIRDKQNGNLTAYRRNIYFPEWLFDLHLTGHKEERFLLKIEAQDQGIPYTVEMATINRNGFFFPVAVPPLGVLLSMKISALLTRAKGRDFYDTLFLMQRTTPDYDFLKESKGISNRDELVTAIDTTLSNVNLDMKCRDFEHLLFVATQAEKVRSFASTYKLLLQ